MRKWKCYTQLAWESLPLRYSCFSGFVVGIPAASKRRSAIEVAYVQGDESTARLIAAAPDLYAAIKDYLDWGPKTGSDLDFLEKQFERAIAKAKGAGA